MARIQKEKGGKLQQKSQEKQKKKAKPTKKSDVLKDEISRLGGNEADYDLVKDADENAIAGPSVIDPTLTSDVSNFLKTLNFNTSEPTPSSSKITAKTPSKKTKKGDEQPSEKPKKQKQKQTEIEPAVTENPAKGKKGKKAVRENDKVQTVEETKEEEPVEETPKVELPTKVSYSTTSTFIFQPTSKWYSAIPPLKPSKNPLPTLNSTQIQNLTSKASDLHATDVNTFRTSSNSSAHTEASFLAKIIQSGTLSDRLSALTLLVQSSPLHNIKALETLKGMAERGKGKGGRDESLKALRCIVDWWVGGGAPDRKLRYFRDQSLAHPSVTDEHFAVWYFEDWLKKYFFSILQILEQFSLDSLPYVRMQTMNLISMLLRDKPEQEQNLLRLLVNKLGDTEKSVCSRASYHILQLLQTHPSMKSVIVREIIALVLRPTAPTAAQTVSAAAEAVAAGIAPLPTHIANRKIKFGEDAAPTPAKGKEKSTAQPEKKKPGNVHARYYATITFNQIVLTPGDRDVALKLIDVYFELFKELLGEGRVDGGDGEDDDGEKREVAKDKKGRVMDGKRGKKPKKGNEGSFKGSAGFEEIEDENSKLISAILTGVNRSLPFAKVNADDAGFMKHIDTLFLITHTSTFNISLQALVLLQQISSSMSTPTGTTSTAKSITDRYYRTLYSSLHDVRLASSSKQAMYLNLLFKSIKADTAGDSERAKALVRRFIQVLVTGGNGATEFVAGGLYLLGELFSTVPGLRSMINEPLKTATEEGYDPRKRDPQFAHAGSSPLWELTPLLHHYHPAISLHARQLLTSQPLTASADLSLNTLSHFLDRFVYKNPKKVSEEPKGKGASAMQPAGSALEGVKLVKGEAAGVMVNEEGFLKKKEGDVPVDQVFFHRFFTRKREREGAGRKMKHGEESEGSEDEDGDDESGSESGEEEMDLTGDEEERAKLGQKDDNDAGDSDSDPEEAEIWKAMKASMPKAEGDDDLMEDSDLDDDDDIPSGLDDMSDDEDGLGSVDGEDDDEVLGEDDDLSLAELSDNDDLVPLDDLIEFDGSGSEGGGEEEEEWGGISSAGDSKKRKRKDDEKDKKGSRRKKLRSLPTFATYEEYAKMIEDGPEDDI